MTGHWGWWPEWPGHHPVMPRSAANAVRVKLADRVGRGHPLVAALVTMGWLASHAPAPPAPSLAQVVCMAKVPVASVRLNDPPLVPGVIQAHLSAFSAPLESVQPPAGFWSVMVSAYSWPFTREMPSRRPAPPALTKLSPQEAPASVT